jgi:hypothetical protein
MTRIENCEVRENQVDSRNHGDCTFGGSTRSFGAGIYVNAGSVTLANDVVTCNTTTGGSCNYSDGGGGVYVNGGMVGVVNSTVARNRDATGIARGGGTLDVLNSIVFFNNADTTQLGGTMTVNYSDVQNRTLPPTPAPSTPTPAVSETGNLNENPVFAGPGCQPDDLQIALGSSAIDAGNPDTQYNDTCFPRQRQPAGFFQPAFQAALTEYAEHALVEFNSPAFQKHLF